MLVIIVSKGISFEKIMSNYETGVNNARHDKIVCIECRAGKLSPVNTCEMIAR